MPIRLAPPAALVLLAAAGHHHGTHIPAWLIHFGGLGLVGVSLLDGSPIPLPLPGSADILLLLLCAQPHSHPVWLAAGTVAGNVAGAYMTYTLGHKGGEAMLHHYAPRQLAERLTRWVREHGVVMAAGSALAPPPTPLLPLLLAQGALGVGRLQFLAAFTGARVVRYGLVAWAGVTYGRTLLHWWNLYLKDWSGTVLWTMLGLFGAALLYGLWQYRRQRRSWAAKQKPESATPPEELSPAPTAEEPHQP